MTELMWLVLGIYGGGAIVLFTILEILNRRDREQLRRMREAEGEGAAKSQSAGA